LGRGEGREERERSDGKTGANLANEETEAREGKKIFEGRIERSDFSD